MQKIQQKINAFLSGNILNADVNGALNILPKSNVASLVALYARGEADTPVRVRIA